MLRLEKIIFWVYWQNDKKNMWAGAIKIKILRTF